MDAVEAAQWSYTYALTWLTKLRSMYSTVAYAFRLEPVMICDRGCMTQRDITS